MEKPVDYKQTLLSIVEDFLAETPERVNHARQTVKEAKASIRHWTLNSLIWGGEFTALSDSIYFEDRAYLLEIRAMLLSGRSDIYRTYLCYDFRPYFSPVEQQLYAALVELVEFLRQFPHPESADSVKRYLEMRARIGALVVQTPPPDEFGEEVIYHFILREIVAVLIYIDLRESRVLRGYLVPGAPYSAFDEGDQPPDVAGDIRWADKALHAIIGSEWLLVTHQITPQVIVVSLH